MIDVQVTSLEHDPITYTLLAAQCYAQPILLSNLVQAIAGVRDPFKMIGASIGNRIGRH